MSRSCPSYIPLLLSGVVGPNSYILYLRRWEPRRSTTTKYRRSWAELRRCVSRYFWGGFPLFLKIFRNGETEPGVGAISRTPRRNRLNAQCFLVFSLRSVTQGLLTFSPGYREGSLYFLKIKAIVINTRMLTLLRLRMYVFPIQDTIVRMDWENNSNAWNRPKCRVYMAKNVEYNYYYLLWFHERRYLRFSSNDSMMSYYVNNRVSPQLPHDVDEGGKLEDRMLVTDVYVPVHAEYIHFFLVRTMYRSGLCIFLPLSHTRLTMAEFLTSMYVWGHLHSGNRWVLGMIPCRLLYVEHPAYC